MSGGAFKQITEAPQGLIIESSLVQREENGTKVHLEQDALQPHDTRNNIIEFYGWRRSRPW